MTNRSPDDFRNEFQRPPSKTSSGDLRSILQQIGHRRREMAKSIGELLGQHQSLFEKIDRLTEINPANGERILNKFWKLTAEQGMGIGSALNELEKYIDEFLNVKE